MTNLANVSGYSPSNRDNQLIETAKGEGLQVRSLRYRNIYDGLSDESPFCGMLRDYLEDIGVASYQTFDIHDSRVRFFLVHSLGLKYNHGLGKLYSNDAVNEIPKIISKMFNNIEVIAEWIQESNRQSIPQRFSRRYVPVQELELKSHGRVVSKRSEETGELPGKTGQFVKSGTMYFYAEGKIKSKSWLHLEVDIGLKMDPIGENPVDVELTATFFGDGLKPQYASKRLANLPTEVAAQSYFSKLIKRAHEVASKTRY